MRQSKSSTSKKSRATKSGASKKARTTAKKSTARKAAPAKKAKPKTAKPKAAARKSTAKTTAKTTVKTANRKTERNKIQPHTVVIAHGEAGARRTADEQFQQAKGAFLFEPTSYPASARDGNIISAPDQEETETHAPKSGDDAEATARTNRLVPTNAVHPTERRQRRRLYQNRALMLTAAATVIGLLILNDQSQPPDVSPLEQRTTMLRDSTGSQPLDGSRFQATRDRDVPLSRTDSSTRPALGDGLIASQITDPTQIPLQRDSGETAQDNDWTTDESVATRETALPTAIPFEVVELNADELVEMERMLERLELNPSRPDGLVDIQTKTAIRLYQQIAGLPINGEPSPNLLADMREVVKLLDGEN